MFPPGGIFYVIFTPEEAYPVSYSHMKVNYVTYSTWRYGVGILTTHRALINKKPE